MLNAANMKPLLPVNDHQNENNVLKGEVITYRTDYENISVGKVFFDNFSKNPDFVSLIHGVSERELTHRELKDRSVRCALWLKKQNISQDNVVATMSDIHLDCFTPFFAATYIGVPFCPLPEVGKKVFQYLMSLMSPKIAFVSEAFVKLMVDTAQQLNLNMKIVVFGRVPGFESFSEILEQQDETEVDRFQCTEITNPHHPLSIVFSSGTTGPAKGVMINHRHFLREVQCQEYLYFGTKVRTFSSLPWVSGLEMYTSAFIENVKMIVCPNFEEDQFCKMVNKYKIEWSFLSATSINQLLNYNGLEKCDISSLKFICNAGTHLRSDDIEACKGRLPNARIIHVYGMTEVGLVTELIDDLRKRGSCGKISRNVELKVVDMKTGKSLGPNEKGEICVKNDRMTNGYYNNPTATREFIDDDGWAHTGDVGYYDEDGFVFILDRINLLIKYLDYQVSPVEIENVLTSYPGVKVAAVVPVSHPVDGEHPMAFVVKVPGAKVTERELMDLVASKLEDYKQIRGGITFLDEIRRGPTGKILRGGLRDMARKLCKNKSL